MKKRRNNSTLASALQVSLAIASMALSAMLLAASFQAAPQKQDGFYPPLPQAPMSLCGTFSNTNTITIPAGAPGTTIGPASPYPSTISLAGLGTITQITVAINGIT